MPPKRVIFEPPALAQLDRWTRDDEFRTQRLRRIVVQKLLVDGDADASTGPSFGRVHSLLTTPTIGNGEYLRILWEQVGDEAHVWALSVELEDELNDSEEPPRE